MVLTGHVIRGLKEEQLWSNKLLVGGSDPLQTTGAVGEWAVSGTQSTLWVSGTISGSSMVWNVANSGAQLLASGSIMYGSHQISTAGSPFTVGDIIQLTTRGIITGGMWVTTSGNSLALSSAASTEGPVGYCLATVGSNATANIITRGIVPFIAEATIEAGIVVRQGAAGALNGIVAAGSPPFGERGITVNRGVSGDTLFVYLF